MKVLGNLSYLVLVLSCMACGGSAGDQDSSQLKEVKLDPERALVQFAQTLGATQDISPTLTEVLETKTLVGACKEHFSHLDPQTGKLPDASRDNPEHVRAMLRCGKWIFFSADFESKMAIPENLIKAIPKIFPEQAGPGYSKLGMIEKPDDKGFPIGFVRLEKSPWGALGAFTGKPRGITCATCHFGKMPDGRYAAGMPNQELDFGKVNAMLMYSAWRADNKQKDENVWAPELQSFYKDLDQILSKSRSPDRTLFDVAKIVGAIGASDSFYKLTGASRPILSETQTLLSNTPNQYYASSPLLPVKDKSYWMSSPQIWEMANFEGDYTPAHGRPLSSFSPVKNAEDFVTLALIFQTGSDKYAKPQYVDPLLLYMRSLKTPVNLNPPAAQAAAQGKRLFEKNCVSCHDGEKGETTTVHDAEETGTPAVLVDPLEAYVAPKDLAASIYKQTVNAIGYEPLVNKGIYSRGLKGIYARRQIMINGSVKDLNSAFCLDGERGQTPAAYPGLSDAVHMDLCRDYDEEEKKLLIAFLESWY